jgi:tRNA threonylcarbamoyladenosine biosynthesis protein TsaB
MLILAFDTTAPACSVAIVKDGAALVHVREVMDQGQAEALVPLIERAMGEAGVGYPDLDRIAVTIGPGSFTGVRVGLATARALGLAAKKPVVGVSSLAVLAAAVARGERERHATILAAVDTKRGDLYVQSFESMSGAPKTAPAAVSPAELAEWSREEDAVIVGDGAREAMKVLTGATASTADPLPDAVVLAQLAEHREIDPAGPLPLYVLPPKITLAPHGGRLRPIAEDGDGRPRP